MYIQINGMSDTIQITLVTIFSVKYFLITSIKAMTDGILCEKGSEELI